MREELVFETVGDFLLRRLRELGISHLFGVAGDFNLEFLEQLAETPDMHWVGCCNELDAAYAADGHARTRGLGALVTTYGVGELSALCGVAGAYSEHVPVVSIAGAPPLADIEQHALLHHTAGDGDYQNMLACAAQFSTAHARLSPQNAVTEIDRCLTACVREKRPVHLQLPSDVAGVKVRVPKKPLVVDFVSDRDALARFEIAAKDVLDKSSSVALLIDGDVVRYGLADHVIRAADRLDCGIAVMGTAKGVIDEDHARYLGTYTGAYSQPEVREAVESADCLINVAVRLADSTTGSFSHKLQNRNTIELEAWRARVKGEDVYGLFLGDALDRLSRNSASRAPLNKVGASTEDSQRPTPSGGLLAQEWFWRRIGDFLRPGDVVAAENGTSLSGMLGVRLPANVRFIAQALWGSIGYTLPATFGSLIGAPNRRHLLFIGDGSFQLTAQELSSILRYRLKPIIFLINNDGYTIERLILGEKRSYNDIQPWHYAELGKVFTGNAAFTSHKVATQSELESALQHAEHTDSCCFIEVVMERMDAPASLRRLGPAYAQQDYGPGYVTGVSRK
jgi:indolepyruvate decarboxylase